MAFLKKYRIGLFVLALIVAGSFAFTPFMEWRNAMSAIKGDETLQTGYNKVLADSKKLSEQTPELYVSVGFQWKTLGDKTAQPYFYKKALSVYRTANANEKTRSALLHLNAGNMYRTLKDYPKAEMEYGEAMKMAPGDDTMYRPQIEMYRYDWKEKKSEDILRLFDHALGLLLFTSNIQLEKASYLEEIGRLDESLRIYQSLRVTYPDQTGLIDKIQTLKYKIEQREQNKLPLKK